MGVPVSNSYSNSYVNEKNKFHASQNNIDVNTYREDSNDGKEMEVEKKLRDGDSSSLPCK